MAMLCQTKSVVVAAGIAYVADLVIIVLSRSSEGDRPATEDQDARARERDFRKARGHTHQVARWLPGHRGGANHRGWCLAPEEGGQPRQAPGPGCREPSPPRASYGHTLA